VYDPRNEAHEFVADGREQATEKAATFFGCSVEELQVVVLDAERVNGLAGRTVVVAAPRDRVAPQRSERRDARGERREPRERGGRERGRDRGRDRDRDRDRGRGRREAREEPATRERRGERALSSEPSVGTARGELGPDGQFVLGVIERLDVGPFEISEAEEGELVVCEVRGDAASALASGDGRPVDALQLLVNQAALRRDEDAKRVVLDVEGSAEAREEFLARLAERVIRRARDGGRAIALDPMSGRDRRIIHLAVREHDGVATMSMGEGRYRQVVVVPEGAPEYEEARQQSEAASRAE
jgi:spoIIIJ-associated protein